MSSDEEGSTLLWGVARKDLIAAVGVRGRHVCWISWCVVLILCGAFKQEKNIKQEAPQKKIRTNINAAVNLRTGGKSASDTQYFDASKKPKKIRGK